jgi:hypothetical protein
VTRNAPFRGVARHCSFRSKREIAPITPHRDADVGSGLQRRSYGKHPS